MIKQRPSHYIAIITYLLILIGCANSSVTEQSQISLTDTPTTEVITASMTSESPTATATLSSPTSLPTTTPILPTPIFPGATEDFIPFIEFIADGFTAECEFPCWYDLRVDKSDSDDIQRFFDDVLGFEGTVDFWESREDHQIALNYDYAITGLDTVEGYQGTGYFWLVSEPYGIAVASYIGEYNEQLEGIILTWNSEFLTYTNFNLRTLFEIIGPPDSIWVGDFNGVGGIIIVYEEGWVLHSFGSQIVVETSPDVVTEYCYGEGRYPEDYQGGEIIITDPFIEKPYNLLRSSFEARYLSYIDRDNLKPVEEVIDTTTEVIVEAVLKGEEACVRTK